jgi:hypothetical protein
MHANPARGRANVALGYASMLVSRFSGPVVNLRVKEWGFRAEGGQWFRPKGERFFPDLLDGDRHR